MVHLKRRVSHMDDIENGKIVYVACELAGDVFRQNKLDGDAAAWARQYWVNYRELATRIVKGLAKIDAGLELSNGQGVSRDDR